MKKVLITGAGGQDGLILTALLAQSPDYKIAHMVRSRARFPVAIEFRGFECDIRDATAVADGIQEFSPDIIFHLAAQSSVAESWLNPNESISVNTQGTLNVLEAVKNYLPTARIVLAGSSEIFARGSYIANESSPIAPSSPYGVSKSTNLELGKIYREVHGLRISTAIMFNHESEFRPQAFVTQEVAWQAARVKLGLQDHIQVRDPDSAKDWGWAYDFVDGLVSMGESDFMEDFVLATGNRSTVKELALWALKGLEIDNTEVRKSGGAKHRPNDIAHPTGDWSKANSLLGWAPTVGPEVMMARMSQAALLRLSN